MNKTEYLSVSKKSSEFFRDVFLDLLYPKRCPLCEITLQFGSDNVCRTCLEKQTRNVPPYCAQCGKTMEDETQEHCSDCDASPKHYERGYPVFAYSGGIKEAIYGFKYKNQRYYGAFFATCMMEQYGEAFENIKLDALIPVPIHPQKKRKRGYNQAQVLAEELGKHLHLPVENTYLIRVVNTSPQKELNDKTRLKNLKNAFKTSENAIKLKQVLLVDDIYTSGATIEACTEVLLEAGVEKVYYTSIAIGRGYSG